MISKRLALNKDGNLTYCTATEENIGKGRCNHLIHQNIGESNESFLNRINEKESLYKNYLPDELYLESLNKQLKKFIPQDLIDEVKKHSNNSSWIIAYGYDEEPYYNKGGWGSTEPYPFITSDGLSFIDMYIKKEEIYNINENNFITPFNRNKNLIKRNGYFLLDKNKKIYKANYPNVDDYEHVFIKHIPSC